MNKLIQRSCALALFTVPCLALLPRSAPAQQAAVTVASFDPGHGRRTAATYDSTPSPSLAVVAAEEMALAQTTTVQPRPDPDFRALGYASLSEMEARIRTVFRIPPDRPVLLSRGTVEGKNTVSIAVGPSPVAGRTQQLGL